MPRYRGGPGPGSERRHRLKQEVQRGPERLSEREPEREPEPELEHEAERGSECEPERGSEPESERGPRRERELGPRCEAVRRSERETPGGWGRESERGLTLPPESLLAWTLRSRF